MSTDLYVYGIEDEDGEDISLPRALKYKLGPRYWNHDGTLWGEHISVNREEIPFLASLAKQGVDGAQQLIDLIAQHNGVTLYLTS